MGSLGPTHMIALFVAVAVVAAICGYVASAVVRRNKRRARGFFFVGFVCGWMAGPILRGRRRGVNALATLVRYGVVRSRSAGIPRSTGRFAVYAFTSAASRVRRDDSRWREGQPGRHHRRRRRATRGVAFGRATAAIRPFPSECS
jgi:uncharacterized membrane protein YeaQ/YmgE (transglycosylase-associated protein family)